jgi:hypothetical protein
MPSDITRRNDIAAEMLDRLPAQFRKPRIQAFVRALANQIQKLEQTDYDLWFRRMLDNAEDVDLNNLGAIVGEERQGRLDDEYRRYIRARIKVNRSNGKLNQLLGILALLVEDDATIIATEHYPAAMVIALSDEVADIDPVYVLNAFLKLAKAAGVRIDLNVPTAARTGTFLLDDSVSPFVDGATQGLDDSVSGGLGGVFASRYA